MYRHGGLYYNYDFTKPYYVLAKSFGDGAYFALKADTSHPYAALGGYIPKDKKLTAKEKKERSRVHTMLLCRIITGKICQGKKGMKKLPEGYNSAWGRSKNQFVIFNSDQISPEVILEYTTQ